VNSLDDTLIRAWLNGYKNSSDNGGTWDMSTRMFPAMAAWIGNSSLPNQFKIRGTTIDIEELTKAILERAFDPECLGSWTHKKRDSYDQRTVESSILAYGAWLLRDTALPDISSRGLTCFKKWLDHFSHRPLTEENWNLFWIVNHSARKALGWGYDQQIIEDGWHIIENLHRGNGWMSDGGDGRFDDYNWWVFCTHELFWAQMDGSNDPKRLKRISDRIQERLYDFPFFFGSDGSYPEFGRSLSYKFARLGGPLLAYKMGLWPHSTGMLRRLVRKHLSYYDNVGAINRETDVVRQELAEYGHPDARDNYINPGHPYWCMLAFTVLWQLDADDPIWTVEEELLPIEKGDFSRTIKPAGWLLQGTAKSGQVQRYSLGSQHGYPAKYGKFLYSTHFPGNLGTVEGDTGPDHALCLTDGVNWAHSCVYQHFSTTEDSLRARYTFTLGAFKIGCETILVPLGEGYFRIHKLSIPPDFKKELTAIEGGAPLGYSPGNTPKKIVVSQQCLSRVTNNCATSLIAGLEGYACGLPARGFRGNERLNAIHDRAITSTIEARMASGESQQTIHLASYALSTLQEISSSWSPPDIETTWEESGAVHLKLEKKSMTISPLNLS
jgi:hypothetical protein